MEWAPILTGNILFGTFAVRSPPAWSLLGDFFGFFGALKKGDFFGVDAKKVPLRVVPPFAAWKSKVSKLRLEFNL